MSQLINDVEYLSKPSEMKLVNNIIDSKLMLTTDNYQTPLTMDFSTIVLPTVSQFTQINLIFSCNSDLTLTFPSIKWQQEPECKNGKIYKYCFTWVNENIGWLGSWISYV